MTAGRELDALVAEKVLGETVTIFDTNPLGYSCKHYSSDIAAAWLIVEDMKSAYDLQLEAFGGGWRATFHEKGHEENCAMAIATTAPHAICLAALEVHKDSSAGT